MMQKFMFCMLALLLCNAFRAQQLKSGFDKNEFIDLMKATTRLYDSAYFKGIEAPHNYTRVYRSPVVGLDNRWDLWMSKDGVAVISIRGTTGKPVSWLENFYAAMVPAKGSLKMSATSTFDYELAQDPKAAVHAGWLLGMASLAPDIVSKIDSCYKKGVRQYIVFGHSQGGAISFLLTAYLNGLKRKQQLPNDIILKTYCSASPKTGNTYFAYDYERSTYGGWAFNVINPADWVPESPAGVQTVYDYNAVNPFTDAKSVIKKQKFPQRLVFRKIYNKLSKPSKKANKRNQKYLGKKAGKFVTKNLPGYEVPTFYNSSNYVRVGVSIILDANEAYYKKNPDNKKEIFTHHSFHAYIYLAEQLPY